MKQSTITKWNRKNNPIIFWYCTTYYIIRDKRSRKEDEKTLIILLQLYTLESFTVIDPNNYIDFNILVCVQISYSFCRGRTYWTDELFKWASRKAKEVCMPRGNSYIHLDRHRWFWGSLIYSVLKTWSFPAKAGSSMGHACPALRESEFTGSAWRIAARVWSEL